MKRFVLSACIAAFVGFVAGFTSFGGWAVVAVLKIPDAWIAGKPLQLQWQVRQHGVTPLYDLKPTLEARSGSRVIEGETWQFSEQGQRGYRGRIIFPTTGEWQVTVNSGFGNSKAVLVPWQVVDSVTKVTGTVADHLAKRGMLPFNEVERGRRMFAAAGCVTCHTHRDVNIKGQLSDFGPDLSDKKFPPDYLAKFLANPSIKPPTNGKSMPNLGLREKEIEPLIAFINSERRVTTR
jgi:mono/diheme cytochrome c family protein